MAVGEKAAVSAQGTPPLSLPKGGGAVRGIGEKFAANPVTGTGSMSVPLNLSPGRSGFGPQLALSYDSGSGNGSFGFGWSMSSPAITRRTDKGLPRYEDGLESDVFVLSGGEDLVPILLPTGERAVDTSTDERYTIHRYRPRVDYHVRADRTLDPAQRRRRALALPLARQRVDRLRCGRRLQDPR